jgi:nitroreductase
MNEIFDRRSVREYKDIPVSDDLVENIIKAGMAAPSAGNEMPWHFIIINDRQKLVKITEIHPYSEMLKTCAVAILVCGDLSLERHKGFWVQDCAAATQNMLLEAVHLELGAVWLGVYPVEKIVKALQSLFGLPENVVPLSIVSLGYPLEKPRRVNRIDNSRIRHNDW